MKLRTPFAGVVIDIEDSRADAFIAKGFVPIAEKPATKRRSTRRKTKEQ